MRHVSQFYYIHVDLKKYIPGVLGASVILRAAERFEVKVRGEIGYRAAILQFFSIIFLFLLRYIINNILKQFFVTTFPSIKKIVS